MKDLIIRKMTRADLDFAIEWAAREGWNPGLYDADVFYETDPDGFFIAELKDEPVGMISAVKYDDTFGFIGFFIVKPEYRGHYIGIALGKQALSYLSNCNIGIDGVLQKVENYKAFGFTFAYQNARYESTALKFENNIDNTFPFSKIQLDQLLDYDRLCFPAERAAFLGKWIKLPESCGAVSLVNNKISGYGLIRKCRAGYKIGPLFADDYNIAENLFIELTNNIQGCQFYLDIPEINDNAVKLADKFKMKKVFATARMYNRYEPIILINKIFGVTSFELG